MPVSPQNVYVKVLVLGDRTLGEQLGQESRDINDGADCLVEEIPED